MNIVDLAQKLIRFPSVTPEDAGCQEFLKDIFLQLGFTVQHFDCNRVKNLWARCGDKDPLFVFAGHTDVVPTGDLSLWHSPPFEPHVRDHYLFGRGACDMKGSLAAMVVATHEFLQITTKFNGSIGFLITSGEEGNDFNDGTPYVMQKLAETHQIPRYCIVGEPSCTEFLGDTIKIGRRGSLNGYLKILGTQGHVAYPQNADNPIHRATAFFDELVHTIWDQGNEFFPPTSFQITKFSADSGGTNVIPGELDVVFNFRYSPLSSQETLQTRVEALLKKHALNYHLDWRLSGLPFLTQEGILLEKTKQVIQETCQIDPILSTSGGTSDGRFIAPYGVDVIELGLINKTIHQINESASIESLEKLCVIYKKILQSIIY
jgi:succinyl-diaminopimelate desuccinylase